MPTPHNYRDLFRHPGTIDKLNFFKSLLDSRELISDLALALIVIIRSELEQPQKQSASAYRRYSDMIICLCTEMPEVYKQVVDTWRQRRQGARLPEIRDEKPQPANVE
jgi:hypothetical protein